MLKITRSQESNANITSPFGALCDKITRFNHFRLARNLQQLHKVTVSFCVLFLARRYVALPLLNSIWCLVHGHRQLLEDFLKLPSPLAVLLHRMTVRTRKVALCSLRWPPEACNQATGQLWGSRGVYRQTARDYMFTLPFLVLVFHSHFHSHTHTRGGIF